MLSHLLLPKSVMLLLATINYGCNHADCHAYSRHSATNPTTVMMDCLNLIEEYARQFYRRQDEFHNERHGERVVAFARMINVTKQADQFLVEAGAWLHQFHDHLDELKLLLRKTGLSEKWQSQLYDIVRLCRPELIHNATSLAARVVFDADALDLMGAYGIVRELSCNTKVRGMNEQEAVSATRKVQALFQEKMVTETGRAMASKRQKEAADFWLAYDQGLIFPAQKVCDKPGL